MSSFLRLFCLEEQEKETKREKERVREREREREREVGEGWKGGGGCKFKGWIRSKCRDRLECKLATDAPIVKPTF